MWLSSPTESELPFGMLHLCILCMEKCIGKTNYLRTDVSKNRCAHPSKWTGWMGWYQIACLTNIDNNNNLGLIILTHSWEAELQRLRLQRGQAARILRLNNFGSWPISWPQSTAGDQKYLIVSEVGKLEKIPRGTFLLYSLARHRTRAMSPFALVLSQEQIFEE